MDLYKIGKITSKLKITPRTIRYYDQLGLLPNVKRSDGQTRLFDDGDIAIIKKLRKIKKQEKISLESIKDLMFPDNFDPDKVLFLTDSESKRRFLLSDNLTEIAFDSSADRQTQLSEFYTACKQSAKSVDVIFCFFDESHAYLYEKLGTKIGKKCYSYSCEGFGLSARLVTEFATVSKPSFSNILELDMILNRMMTLSFNICIYDNLERFIDKRETPADQIIELLQPFSPIMLSRKNEKKVLSYQDDFFEVLSLIAENVDDELMRQKRYCEKARIYHYNAEGLANAIKEHIVELCPNLIIDVQAIEKWHHIKNNGICISII